MANRIYDPYLESEVMAADPVQLIRLLYRHTRKHLAEARASDLDRAAKLLSARAGNVSEIGYACGFSSVSQFSRAFKAHFGVAPSGYLPETITGTAAR